MVMFFIKIKRKLKRLLADWILQNLYSFDYQQPYSLINSYFLNSKI